MTPAKVSILMPIWNEERYLSRSLDALLAQEYAGEIEIVVADGDSSDRSVEVVRSYMARHPNIRLAHNPSRNTAVGRNVCLAESSGEIVVNYVAHSLVPPDFVATLARKLQAAPAAVAAVGAGNVAPADDAFPGQVIAAVYGSLLGGAKSVDQNARYDRDREVPSIAFVAMRAEVVRALGGYDAALWCGEDFDLNYRIGKAGYKIVYTPDTVAWRYNRSSLGAFWRQMYRYGIARSLILRKHPDSFRLAYVLPAAFCLYVASGAVAAVAAPATAPWYAGSLLLYALLGWLSAASVSRRPRLVLVAPAYYFTVHFAYGAGLLRGLLGGRRGRLW